MTHDELNKRLLSIQMRLESHDNHWADCSCNFCEAIYELAALRSEIRTQELLAQKASAA